MRQYIEKILSFFWPEVCPFCQKACKKGICDTCRKRLESIRIKEPRCMRCGKQIRIMEKEYCYDCLHTHHYYDRGISLWLHREPVNQSIYQFKYHNQRRYGTIYAQEILYWYKDVIVSWHPDVIMPVPLHFRRKRKRGYNQARILAELIGTGTGIAVDSRHLIRRKYTNPQKILGHRQRKKNLKNAFAVKKDFVPVKTVLLIDDIYTTGSTIDAAAYVLKQRGVVNVYFLTISIGQGY